MEITTFSFLAANVHLVREGAAAILVDTGVEGQERRIERKLRQAGVAPASLSLIICSHGHYDHCGNAGYFQSAYRIPVAAGEGDLPMIRAGHMPKLQPYTFLDKLVQVMIVKDRIPSFEP